MTIEKSIDSCSLPRKCICGFLYHDEDELVEFFRNIAERDDKRLIVFVSPEKRKRFEEYLQSTAAVVPEVRFKVVIPDEVFTERADLQSLIREEHEPEVHLIFDSSVLRAEQKSIPEFHILVQKIGKMVDENDGLITILFGTEHNESFLFLITIYIYTHVVKGGRFYPNRFHIPDSLGKKKTELFQASAELILNSIFENIDYQEHIEETTRFLEDIFEAIQDGISILDCDLTIVRVNEAMNRWHESNLPLEGKKCYQAYHNADEPCQPCPTLRAFQSGRLEIEVVPGLPGSPVEWFELYCYPVKDPATGEVTRVVEYVRDITEKRRVSEALKAEKEKYQRLFNFSNDGIIVHDMKGNILDVNRKAIELLGYSRDQFLEKKIYELHPDYALPESQKAFKAIRESHHIRFEIDFRRKDGTVFPGEVSSTLMEIEGRQVVQGIVRDITERKQAEEEFRKNAQRLEILYNIARYEGETLKDLLEFALQSALDLSESEYGYIFTFNEGDKRFHLRLWSHGVKENCKLDESVMGEKLQDAGLWGEAIRRREPLVVNDFSGEEEMRKGYPKGHLQLRRWLGIPVFFNQKIVATLGVANKKREYSERDVQRLTLLMDSVWRIVEQKRAQKALIQSEERYRRLIENSNDAIYLLVNGRFELINKRFTEMLGYTLEDLNRDDFDFMSLYAPESIPYIQERSRRIEQGEEVEPIYQFVGYTKDGRKIYCETSVSYIRYGDTLATQGIIRDVTKRVEDERALREFRQRLHHLIQNTPVGYIEWDTSFRVREWNPAAEKMFGYSRDEALGKTGDELIIPPELRDELQGIWKDLLQNKGGLRNLNENLTRDGRRIICEWYNTPLMDEEGKVVGVASLVEDITEQEQMQRQLQESEEKFHSYFDNASDSIIIVNQEGQVLDVNQTAIDLFGMGKDEFLSNKFQNLVSPEEREALTQNLLNLSEKGVGGFEVTCKTSNEKEIPMEVNARQIHFGDSEAIILNLRDLSERRLLESQLYQVQKMESVGRLAGGIAHDFNNLLSVITGYSSLILEELNEKDPIYNDIQEIFNAAEKGSQLTQQLLAFSRKQVLKPEIVNVNKIVNRLRGMLQRLLGEDILLTTILCEQVKPIRIDPGQLEQVIINLAVNARDAMPDGGNLTIETDNVYLNEEYTITHQSMQPGEYVMLVISDTGFGIEKELLDKIFEPFFTTKEQGRGTGLGLATVYGIVKQSNGYIWVYSEPGRGTTFKLYFPVGGGDSEIEELSTEEGTSDFMGKETILVIEDDDNVREMINRILSSKGYNVLIARNGGEALLVCERYKDPIDLILIDVIMPQANGKTIAERILQTKSEAKVLYMSGYTDNVIVHHGILEEGLNFINKPFSPSQLLRKIREILGNK